MKLSTPDYRFAASHTSQQSEAHWAVSEQAFAEVLPQHVSDPGAEVASVMPHVRQQWGLPASCIIRAGTTGLGLATCIVASYCTAA